MFFFFENRNELTEGGIRVRGARKSDFDAIRDCCLSFFDKDYVATLAEAEKDKLATSALRHNRFFFVEREGEEGAIGIFEAGENKALRYDSGKYAKKYFGLTYRELKESGLSFESTLRAFMAFVERFERKAANYFFEINADFKYRVEDLARNGFIKDDKSELSPAAMDKLDAMLKRFGLVNGYRTNDIYLRVIAGSAS